MVTAVKVVKAIAFEVKKNVDLQVVMIRFEYLQSQEQNSDTPNESPWYVLSPDFAVRLSESLVKDVDETQ